jgi:hypothetical protein
LTAYLIIHASLERFHHKISTLINRQFNINNIEEKVKMSEHRENDDRDDSEDDEQPTLSAATLEALKLFALSTGIKLGGDSSINDGAGGHTNTQEEDNECVADSVDIIAKVRDHFDVKDRDQVFHCSYEDGDRKIEFDVNGVKRQLGQTLSSTGLTM